MHSRHSPENMCNPPPSCIWVIFLEDPVCSTAAFPTPAASITMCFGTKLYTKESWTDPLVRWEECQKQQQKELQKMISQDCRKDGGFTMVRQQISSHSLRIPPCASQKHVLYRAHPACKEIFNPCSIIARQSYKIIEKFRLEQTSARHPVQHPTKSSS